jgi:uncharacterized protein YigE (DUF2233 family)
MMRWLVALVALIAGQGVASAAPACQTLRFAEADYTVCRFEPGKDRLALFNLDAAGAPYGGFAALAQDLERQGRSLAFAMNAGMFDDTLKPIGLYVEKGRLGHKLNRRSGSGNFHLKPNGVFFIENGKPQVMETEAYAKGRHVPEFATQSGPMLVVNGAIHPKFSADGTSRKRRNGVGVAEDGTVVFAITEGYENFYDFARLFRDGLNCRNALFLDGSVSSLYDADSGRNDGFLPLGPMVAVVK